MIPPIINNKPLPQFINNKLLPQFDFSEGTPSNKGIDVENGCLNASQFAVELANKKIVHLNTASAQAFLQRNPSLSDPRANVSVAVRIQELVTTAFIRSAPYHQARLKKLGLLEEASKTVKSYEPQRNDGSELTKLASTTKIFKHLHPTTTSKIGFSCEEALCLSLEKRLSLLERLKYEFKEITILLKDYLPKPFNLDLEKLQLSGDRKVLNGLIARYKDHWFFSDDEQQSIKLSLRKLQKLYSSINSPEDTVDSELAKRQSQLERLKKEFKEITILLKDYLPKNFNLDLEKLLFSNDSHILNDLIIKYEDSLFFTDAEQQHIRSSLSRLQTLYPATDPHALESKQDAVESSAHPHETLQIGRRQREEMIDTSKNSNKKDGPITPPQGTGDYTAPSSKLKL